MATNTPGMEIAKGKNNFPFGWSSLQEFCIKEGLGASDFSTWTSPENKTGIEKTFIKFPSQYFAILFVAFLINKRKWNLGSWFSTNPEKQLGYTVYLDRIKPRIVDAL
jgi:hypothetical protein